MTDTITKVEAILPFFPGFYNSVLDDLVDREVVMRMENEGLTWEECDAMADYRKAWLAISQAWVEAVAKETGIQVTYKAVESPREYNFTTDRCVVEITREELARVRKIAEDGGHLDGVLKRHFKSRDGFISFYDHERELWDEKETAELDCNEAMAYLEAAVLVDFMRDDLIYSLLDESRVYEAAAQVWTK